MRLSVNNFINRKKLLESTISFMEKQLGQNEPGKLWVCSSKDYDQYYFHDKKEGKNKIYLGTTATDQVIKLAQQEYYVSALKAAIDELKTLNILIKKYQKGVVEDIYDRLPSGKQKLVTPVMLNDEEFVKQWMEKPYPEVPKKFRTDFEKKNVFSDKGLAVRSKTEASISNKYDAYGIPMKYEEPLYLKGVGWVLPDFKLLNVRLRKELIHEHMGMMDDPQYADKNVEKINNYMRNGYMPGKNLILTFETRNEPFDARLMDLIIESYLL